MKIQKKSPDGKQIKMEIKYSILSLIMYSMAFLLVFELSIRGYTLIYFSFNEHSVLYAFISLLLAIIYNDAAFYWSHRFMHIKGIFKYVHLQHHKSKNPSPFSMLSFHPYETVINAIVYILIAFIIPIHPITLGVFLLYNLFNNVAGHDGYEIMSEKSRKHWLLGKFNTITNHDTHHAKPNFNYGNYFIFWDWAMNTLYKNEEG